jgi:hypothetical protein
MAGEWAIVAAAAIGVAGAGVPAYLQWSQVKENAKQDRLNTEGTRLRELYDEAFTASAIWLTTMAFEPLQREEARAALKAVLDRVAMYAPHPVAMAAYAWSLEVSTLGDNPDDRMKFMNTVRRHAGVPLIQPPTPDSSSSS